MKDPRITFSLPAELLKRVHEYCAKYQYGQGEFLRNLIRNKLYEQIPAATLPSVESCSVCNLPKKEMIQEICFDCFGNLPDAEQQNFHPLQP